MNQRSFTITGRYVSRCKGNRSDHLKRRNRVRIGIDLLTLRYSPFAEAGIDGSVADLRTRRAPIGAASFLDICRPQRRPRSSSTSQISWIAALFIAMDLHQVPNRLSCCPGLPDQDLVPAQRRALPYAFHAASPGANSFPRHNAARKRFCSPHRFAW
jgi:hypothetical protein